MTTFQVAEDLVDVDELDGWVDLLLVLLESGTPGHEDAPHVRLLRVVPGDAELRLLEQVPRVRLREAGHPRGLPPLRPLQLGSRAQYHRPRLQIDTCIQFFANLINKIIIKLTNVHLGQNEDRWTVRVVRPVQLLRDLVARVDVDVVVLAQPLPEGDGNLVCFSAN